jgi:hypothetical protein
MRKTRGLFGKKLERYAERERAYLEEESEDISLQDRVITKVRDEILVLRRKNPMTKTVYKRWSITHDPVTIRKCKELANAKGQSVSAMLRYLVAEAFEEITAGKRVPSSQEDC